MWVSNVCGFLIYVRHGHKMVIYTLGNPPAILSIVEGKGPIDDINGKLKIPTQVNHCAIMYNLIRFCMGLSVLYCL